MEKKVMSDYTCYCTEEQTKKALELGAPIIILPNYAEFKGFPFVRCQNGNEYPCQIPTAEQMISWLEEQEGIKCIDIYRNCDYWGYGVITNITTYDVTKHFSTRKGATLAAISTALDYLIANKK